MFKNDNENDIHDCNVDNNFDDIRLFAFSVIIVEMNLLHTSMWK